MGEQEPAAVDDSSALDETSDSTEPGYKAAGMPALFQEARRSLRVLAAKLVAIDHKPHEQKDLLVGISCLALATPAIPAYCAGDLPTVFVTLGMTITSLNADYLYLGTVWNVIDRWCALGFSFYMYWLAFPHLPLLSSLNAIPLVGFLSYSRSSATKEQWSFRHSLWHFFLAVDMPFFLVFGAYSDRFFKHSEVISNSSGGRKPTMPWKSPAKLRKHLDADLDPGADEATEAGEACDETESSDSEPDVKPPPTPKQAASAALQRLVAQRNNNHKVLQRLNAEILGHQRNVLVLFCLGNWAAMAAPEESEVFLSSELHAVTTQSASRNRARWMVAHFGCCVAGVVVCSLAVLGYLRSSLPRAGLLRGSDLMRGYEDDCFKVGMYYAGPARLPSLQRTVQPDAQACQAECMMQMGCQYFTFWPDGGCLLTGWGATLKATPLRFAKTVTGPKECPLARPVAADQGLTLEDWDPSVDGAAPAPPTLPHEPEFQIVVAGQLPGVNGTHCTAYPACVAVKMSGDCCPNAEGVVLDCCGSTAASRYLK
ncbi:unnamed protein product [Symbiodinium natans]|uniref:Apple domain-containing protein n=1 Tax=Symbiodinium natans TaxID=878477 RepID=A0A812SJR2_9DINO|nr:unnamed protein product [Symbiodinium natans]